MKSECQENVRQLSWMPRTGFSMTEKTGGSCLLNILVGELLSSWAAPTTATSSPGGLLQAPTRAQSTEMFFLGRLFSTSVLFKGMVEHAPWVAERLRENQRLWNPAEKSLKEMEDFLGWNRVSSSSAPYRAPSNSLIQCQASHLTSAGSVYAPCIRPDWANFIFHASILRWQRREWHLGVCVCLWIIWTHGCVQKSLTVAISSHGMNSLFAILTQHFLCHWISLQTVCCFPGCQCNHSVQQEIKGGTVQDLRHHRYCKELMGLPSQGRKSCLLLHRNGYNLLLSLSARSKALAASLQNCFIPNLPLLFCNVHVRNTSRVTEMLLLPLSRPESTACCKARGNLQQFQCRGTDLLCLPDLIKKSGKQSAAGEQQRKMPSAVVQWLFLESL